MVELSVKVVIAGVAMFLCGLTGEPSMSLTASCVAIFGAVEFLGWRVEKRQLMSVRVAGLFAIAHAALILTYLAGIRGFIALEALGAIALAPCYLAMRRHRTPIIAMAPAVATIAIIAYSANHQWTLPPISLLAQWTTLIGIAGLSQPVRMASTARSETTEALEPAPTAFQNNGLLALEQRAEVESQLEEVRESYRLLREAYRDLERKSRKDRVCASIAEARSGNANSVMKKLVDRVLSMTGASGAVLYTVANFADIFVVRAFSGDVPQAQADQALEISPRQAIARIREQADNLAMALFGDQACATIVLQQEGRVVGLLTLNAPTQDELLAAMETASLAAPVMATTLVEELRKEAVERRLHETEVLYAVVATTDGAWSRTDVASRVVKDLSETLGTDHIAVCAVENSDFINLAQEGRAVNVLDQMSFEYGDGIAGWLASGSPEIAMMDVRSDGRLPVETSLKMRIGSYVAIPLIVNEQTYGAITAATTSVGRLDVEHVETLRAAAAELGRLFTRFEADKDRQEGLLTPKQFTEEISGQKGYLVTLEPLKMDHLIERFGRPAMNHALRQLGLRLRTRMPQGSLLCRHPDGIYLAFVPGDDARLAMTWANEVTALGPQLGIRTPDGSQRVPLALRTKVASMDSQNNQFLLAA